MLPMCVISKALKKKIGGCELFSFLLQLELRTFSNWLVSTAWSEPSLRLPSLVSHTSLSYLVFISKDERGGCLI